MNNDKQRIYSGDWKPLHPYTGSASTDLYYITLANKVLDRDSFHRKRPGRRRLP